MKLPLQTDLVPPHIDGFVLRSDFRLSRFSAIGRDLAEVRKVAEHSRVELELNLVLGGEAHILIGEQRVTLETQQMLWIRPRQKRLVIDASRDFLAWVLAFRPRLVRRVCTTAASAPLRQQGGSELLLRRIARPEHRALSQLFASLPVGEGRDVFNAGLGYALARAWLAFMHAEPTYAFAELHPAVRKAAWLLRDGNTELSNAELAARVNLSAHRLSRLFKRQMGTALVEFRNRQRLQRLLNELEDDETRNLLGLALDVGFGSYTQFHRVFKRVMGCSPAQYQKQKRVTTPSEPRIRNPIGL
jgi:AraC-like DNA-binding protein